MNAKTAITAAMAVVVSVGAVFAANAWNTADTQAGADPQAQIQPQPTPPPPSATVGASGTFTDRRDGKKYKTTVIGGKRWMAENLNYQPQSGKSWCYDNNNSNCGKYGRLYDWITAKVACPLGWHLPSREEWDSLGQAAGGESNMVRQDNIDWDGVGKKLKARSGWDDFKGQSGNGTDDYGFSALPGGRCGRNGDFSGVGFYGFWWTAAEEVRVRVIAYYRNTAYLSGNMYEGRQGKDDGLSVRCVAD